MRKEYPFTLGNSCSLLPISLLLESFPRWLPKRQSSLLNSLNSPASGSETAGVGAHHRNPREMGHRCVTRREPTPTHHTHPRTSSALGTGTGPLFISHSQHMALPLHPHLLSYHTHPLLSAPMSQSLAPDPGPLLSSSAPLSSFLVLHHFLGAAPPVAFSGPSWYQGFVICRSLRPQRGSFSLPHGPKTPRGLQLYLILFTRAPQSALGT